MLYRRYPYVARQYVISLGLSPSRSTAGTYLRILTIAPMEIRRRKTNRAPSTSQTKTKTSQLLTSLSGEEEGRWEFEGKYVFMLQMDGPGERVVRTVEFLDSKKTHELRPLMRTARKRLEAREGKGDSAGMEERGVL